MSPLSPRLTDLLLIRLLAPSKSPPSPATVRKTLSDYLPHPLTAEQWDSLVSDARQQGFLPAKGLRLTEKGEAKAKETLGLKKLPAKCNWETLKSRYLTPLAGNWSSSDSATPLTAEQMAARLLIQEKGLTVRASASLTEVMVALFAKELDLPEATDLNQVFRGVLSRLCNSDEPLASDELRKLLPKVLLGTRKNGTEGLRQKVISNWLKQPVSDPTRNGVPFDLKQFADEVQKAALRCPTGKFGENNVFINHLWRFTQSESLLGKMDLLTFKKHLLDASIQHLLSLTRADLPLLVSPEDVRESEVEHLNSTYHFIRI